MQRSSIRSAALAAAASLSAVMVTACVAPAAAQTAIRCDGDGCAVIRCHNDGNACVRSDRGDFDGDWGAPAYLRAGWGEEGDGWNRPDRWHGWRGDGAWRDASAYDRPGLRRVCDPDGDRCYFSRARWWNYREYYRVHGYHWIGGEEGYAGYPEEEGDGARGDRAGGFYGPNGEWHQSWDEGGWND